MSAFGTIDYAVDDGIATVTLSRPEVVNAFSVQMRDDLHEALTVARDDTGVRGVLLRGAGERGFCAGADLTEFGTAPSQAIARRVRRERDVWGLLASLPKPTVAAIHGYCMGSGVELACLCDLRVAGDDAVFAMPEVSLVLVPAAGGTQLLPRLLGPGQALNMLLTGRRLTASEAWDCGLVTQVVARDALLDAATALLRRVLKAPDAALHATKRAIRDGIDLSLAQGLALEARLAVVLAGGAHA